MSALWTLRRATLSGTVAGLAALLLWPAFALAQEPLRWPFVIALAVTALSGASILGFVTLDLLTVKRGRRVRPARAFDLVLGLLFTVPAALALAELV